MPFHVMVESLAGKGNQRVAEFDKESLDEVVKDFVEPYVAQTAFTVDGYIIDPKKVKRFVVRKSALKIDAIVDEIYRKMPPNVIMVVGRDRAFESADFSEDITKGLLKAAMVGGPPAISALPKTESLKLDLNKVFIVHGHDAQAEAEAARFVQKLGFSPVILHERESKGMTIIEKIEANANVGFAIVLYTADDVGAKKSESHNLQARARQNVVFEHGYLIGKLGRGSVVALVKGSLELPNDLSGVVYVGMDDAGAWRIALAKELKAVGYPVDLNDLIK